MLSLILLLTISSHIRFGIHHFITFFFTILGWLLLLGLLIFFLQTYFTNSFIYENKKLNIAKYKNLNERDYRILKRIQKNEKYFSIANEEGLSQGYLKNRLHLIFSTIECGDKRGFMSFYDDWELIFDPSQQAKK